MNTPRVIMARVRYALEICHVKNVSGFFRKYLAPLYSVKGENWKLTLVLACSCGWERIVLETAKAPVLGSKVKFHACSITFNQLALENRSKVFFTPSQVLDFYIICHTFNAKKHPFFMRKPISFLEQF